MKGVVYGACRICGAMGDLQKSFRVCRPCIPEQLRRAAEKREAKRNQRLDVVLGRQEREEQHRWAMERQMRQQRDVYK